MFCSVSRLSGLLQGATGGLDAADLFPFNLARAVSGSPPPSLRPACERERRSAAVIELSAHTSLRWRLPAEQHLGADTQEEEEEELSLPFQN